MPLMLHADKVANVAIALLTLQHYGNLAKFAMSCVPSSREWGLQVCYTADSITAGSQTAAQ